MKTFLQFYNEQNVQATNPQQPQQYDTVKHTQAEQFYKAGIENFMNLGKLLGFGSKQQMIIIQHLKLLDAELKKAQPQKLVQQNPLGLSQNEIT